MNSLKITMKNKMTLITFKKKFNVLTFTSIKYTMQIIITTYVYVFVGTKVKPQNTSFFVFVTRLLHLDTILGILFVNTFDLNLT